MTTPSLATSVERSAGTWVRVTLLITVLVTGAVAAANRLVNRYGVFGEVHGRQLVVSQNERLTKYLFATNYVPANFDGLLMGPSITDNWNTAAIHSARVYNASVLGANVSEESAIASNVFDRRHLRVAIVTIHSHLTLDHLANSGALRPVDRWSALGSIQLTQTYLQDVLIRIGRRRGDYDAFGRNNFPAPRRTPEAVARTKAAVQSTALTVDSIAVREYVELLAKAHVSADYVIGLIPPTSDERTPEVRAVLDAYTQKMRTLFSPADSVIDFNAPEFAAFRSDPGNFSDGVHLTTDAAQWISTVLGARVDAIVGPSKRAASPH